MRLIHVEKSFLLHLKMAQNTGQTDTFTTHHHAAYMALFQLATSRYEDVSTTYDEGQDSSVGKSA